VLCLIVTRCLKAFNALLGVGEHFERCGVLCGAVGLLRLDSVQLAKDIVIASGRPCRFVELFDYVGK
jgi:hypothetical protein